MGVTGSWKKESNSLAGYKDDYKEREKRAQKRIARETSIAFTFLKKNHLLL